jgi:hypothetical protein
MIYIRPRVKPPALIDNLGLGIIFLHLFRLLFQDHCNGQVLWELKENKLGSGF